MSVDETPSTEILKTETLATTEKPEVEINFETIDNFSRVVPAQLRLIQFPMDSRFQPVSISTWKGGVLVLNDTGSGDFETHEIEKNEK